MQGPEVPKICPERDRMTLADSPQKDFFVPDARFGFQANKSETGGPVLLRIVQSVSAEQAKKYFAESLSKLGYYAEGQEFSGEWYGRGASALGLKGYVTQEAYNRLCDNLHPQTGKRLTQRMDKDRRPGYDFSWSVPKSVSLAYMWTKDERILQAIRQAIYDTMLEIEAAAATRVRAGGQDCDRITGNLVWAEFIHMTARPVGGVSDPQIHAHCFVMNTTWDEVEGKWKAAQIGDIKADGEAYETAYMFRLSQNLKALGLEIANKKQFFELAGAPPALTRKFSRRSQVVAQKAEELGLTSAKQKDGLAAITRESKNKEFTLDELREIWWARVEPYQREWLDSLKPKLAATRQMTEEVWIPPLSGQLGHSKTALKAEESADERRRVSLRRATKPVDRAPSGPVVITEHDRRAVNFAIRHLFERQCVVTENQLIAEVKHSWAYGLATIEGIRAAVKEAPLIRIQDGSGVLLTTWEVRAEEGRLIDKCVQGKGKFQPMNPNWKIRDEELNLQQQQAVYHVIHSRDFVMGIRGRSGVGKTRLLHEAEAAIKAAGHKLLILTPEAETAYEEMPAEGFENTRTVAKLLYDETLQSQFAGGIWWVDEAALVSNPAMDKFLLLAERLSARVVLAGDPGQNQPVERGCAFKVLEKFGEMEVVTIDEIVRQRGLYRQAVNQIADRNFNAAFGTLCNMGAIYEAPMGEWEQCLAKDYLEAVTKDKSALVVCPTHAECENVNTSIRAELKNEGKLKNGYETEVLRDRHFTEAQKEDPFHYLNGMVVRVTRHLKGFSLGETMKVVEVGEYGVWVEGKKGTFELPLDKAKSFNVYEREAIEICEGERIRITANTRTAEKRRLYNGSTYTVKGFDKEGSLILNNDAKLPRNFSHMYHGYSTTSHSAQGKTVDSVFVAASMTFSGGASGAEQFYVAVSRGKEDLKIYTESLEGLRDNVTRIRERRMAMEVMSMIVPPAKNMELQQEQSEIEDQAMGMSF